MNVEFMESRLAQRPTSPLFARLAGEYLERGEPGKGAQLCRAGLEHFPDYVSAHVVLARCLAAQQDYPSALSELQQAFALTTQTDLLRQFQTQWETQNAAAASPGEAIAPAPSAIAEPPMEVVAPEQVFVEEPPLDALAAEHVMVEEPPADVVPTEPAFVEEPSAESLAPEPLAAEPPAGAAAPAAAQQQAVPEEDNRIVSRTLAEIYARQGEFLEAIITYQLLKRQRPDLSDEFDGRIRELEIKLQEKLAG